jgi:hypothetical protein
LAFKPQLALVIPICLAAGGHWRTFVSTGVTALTLTLASLAVFGLECWMSYFENATSFAHYYFSSAKVGTEGWVHWQSVPTVGATVQKLTDNETMAWSLQIIAGLVAAAAASLIWIRSRDPLCRSLALVSAMFLATPKALYYDVGVFAIPLAYLAADAARGQLHASGFLLAATLWMFPFFGELAGLLGWQPGPLILLVSLAYAGWRAHRDSISPDDAKGCGKSRGCGSAPVP